MGSADGGLRSAKRGLAIFFARVCARHRRCWISVSETDSGKASRIDMLLCRPANAGWSAVILSDKLAVRNYCSHDSFSAPLPITASKAPNAPVGQLPPDIAALPDIVSILVRGNATIQLTATLPVA